MTLVHSWRPRKRDLEPSTHPKAIELMTESQPQGRLGKIPAAAPEQGALRVYRFAARHPGEPLVSATGSLSPGQPELSCTSALGSTIRREIKTVPFSQPVFLKAREFAVASYSLALQVPWA